MTTSAYFVASWRHLRAQRRSLQGHGRVARGAEKFGSQVGEGRGGALFVAVDEQHLTAGTGAGDGDVDGKRRLADAALDVADGEDHTSSVKR
jgi:hypothetical protein